MGDPRIELLEEMLAKAHVDLAWKARDLEQASLRPISGAWAGYAVALAVVAEWKAMVRGLDCPPEMVPSVGHAGDGMTASAY